ARQMGLQCVALLGKDGGDLKRLADVPLIVPSEDIQHIQEVQLVLIHLLCELIEERVVVDRQLRSEAQDLARNIWEEPHKNGHVKRNGYGARTPLGAKREA